MSTVEPFEAAERRRGDDRDRQTQTNAPRMPSVSCGRWDCKPGRPCPACRVTALDAIAAEHRAWFERTGHCAACGCPGTYCICRTQCGCHELHEVGSGLREGALDAFAETVVSDEQGALFDD